MLVEATLDFPEEEIDFLRKADAEGQLQRLQENLGRVMQRAHQGALLREGINVVIAGQPNAGKSSLLNALAGAELAIVTPIPGTTRDIVRQTIQIEGVPLHVVDTAGLREGADQVERIGIERAWGQIEKADAVVFLHDLTRVGSQEYQQADAAIAAKLPQDVPVVEVWNKSDVASVTPAQAGAQGARGARHREPWIPASAGMTGIHLSAKTGAGLEHLRHRLLELAGWQAAPEGVFIARERHLHALRRVDAHLMEAAAHLAREAQALDLLAEELRLAQNALSEITGEFSADDLLGVIFSRFCIGK
jgi:tRNA modification GTPase